MYTVLNYYNVSKHAEFYTWYLRFNVTSTGLQGADFMIWLERPLFSIARVSAI
jgi:hypothetical protein